MLVAVRAVHMKSKTKLRAGIALKKLICAGSQYIEHRQLSGLERMLQNSKARLQHPILKRGRFVHVNYAHLWDEVRVRSRWKASRRFRTMKKAVFVPTMMQRGIITMSLQNASTKKVATYSEYWLVKPLQMTGTKATDELPTVRRGFPKQFDFDDIGEIQKLLKQVSSYTFSPCVDEAGANLSILKRWGCNLETAMTLVVGPGALFKPTTCQTHRHHNCKAQLKDIKPHIMRHYGMSRQTREGGILNVVFSRVEYLVRQRMKGRNEGPPPEDALKLREVVDVLFKFDDKHHTRKHDKKSQFWHDLDELCKHINGDICEATDTWTCHWCNNAQTQQKCCQNDADYFDQTTVKVTNACFGRVDSQACESRWTETLPGFKMTLLRYLLKKVGTDAFPSAVVDFDPAILPGVDGESTAAFIEYQVKLRSKRNADYLALPWNMFQLAVFTVALGAFDGDLLYPFLDDPLGDGSTLFNPLPLVLDPRESKVIAWSSTGVKCKSLILLGVSVASLEIPNWRNVKNAKSATVHLNWTPH
jgi:hypothetical protein